MIEEQSPPKAVSSTSTWPKCNAFLGYPLSETTIAIATHVEILTIKDLLDQLGGIPPERVRFRPLPGTATEQDVLDVGAREDRICELIDGVLVEKAKGLKESFLALWLGRYLIDFVQSHNLGLVAGADGTVRLNPGLVRIPDIAFFSWDRLPGRRVPSEPIPLLAPNLAIEVLSASNAKAEMARKRREYFEAGVRLVWEIDPEKRIATVYLPGGSQTVLDASQSVDGAEVLPGFRLRLADLFAELDRQG